MKTEEELIKELYQNEAIVAKIKQELLQIKKNRFDASIESLRYLINKCFKFVGTYRIFCYKIIAITDTKNDTLICDVIVIMDDEINYQSKFDHIVNTDGIGEISLEQFESIMDIIYHNLKNKS